jgi:hypothetical protein
VTAKHRTAFLAACLFVACTREAPPQKSAAPASAETRVDDSAERTNLIDLANGTTVIGRTGEALLEYSALRTIDGDPESTWLPPPHDLPQSITFALPARTRIEKVGMRTVAKGGLTAKHVQFEVSADGQRFAPLTTTTSAVSNDAQWFDVRPAVATHLRVTMIDSVSKQNDLRINSILVRGAELQRLPPGDLAGCWKVNGAAAKFARKGDHLVGVLETEHEPIRFDGGTDGRLYRLGWIRGNDYGLAAITVSPDGAHLSGIEWHEEAIPLFFGDSWFGERQKCNAVPGDGGDVAPALLRRTGRFSLFGLRFRDDASLDETASRDALDALKRLLTNRRAEMRFVAHEFRRPSPQQNRDFAQGELAALRQELESAHVNLESIDFVAQGSDDPRQTPASNLMRALYSTVDLEIRR